MIKRYTSQLAMAALLFSVSLISINLNAQSDNLFKKTLKAVSPSSGGDVDMGLKQALEFGVKEAVNTLSADKGYFDSPYKILIPDEAKVIIDKVKVVPGFQDVEKQLIDKMNKAAELAAKEATPIFVDAIKSLSIKDATNILMGKNDAATRYLETETRPKLYGSFLPVIQSALDEVNARTYWTSVINAYNSIPFVKKVNPELDDYVNNKALDGLFGLIQVKEEKIRTDQSQRTTDLLKKVFGQQDKG